MNSNESIIFDACNSKIPSFDLFFLNEYENEIGPRLVIQDSRIPCFSGTLGEHLHYCFKEASENNTNSDVDEEAFYKAVETEYALS